MKKVLFVATVVKMHVMVFHIPYLELFKKKGYEVHVCAQNDYENSEDCIIPFCDKFYDVPLSRSPFNGKNIKAYRQLQEIIINNKYDIIHCHTPVGGVLTRIAAKKARKEGTKVIYTAHGFHFFKGAKIINWILFYPIERWLARYTDVLITINKEDYDRVKKFKAKKVVFVPGVGVDTKKYKVDVNRDEKRRDLGIPINSFVILSVGELSKRKNFEVIIRALAKINNSDIKYIICGKGHLQKYLSKLATEYKVDVIFLGFRSDINEICSISDLFAFPSYQEGLPVALMEAMAAGLPIVCSNIRGNTDLIEDNIGGFLSKPDDVNKFALNIEKVQRDIAIRQQMKNSNLKKIVQYDMNTVCETMKNIYEQL